jgi:ectoine hydroxylase-related dioxygenase (phytanoyl-CoA dioxygenase family)
MLTIDHVQAFDRDGSCLVEGLFSPEEVAALLAAAEANHRPVMDMPDADGRSSTLSLWTDNREDPFGAVTRSARIVTGARMLLRDDVYHWHSKIMRKEPRVGGAWEWHQDYGYWYNDGCLAPRLVSCMVALDHAEHANGCLRVIPGSHLLGRFEHGGRGKQAGADPDRVAAALERLGERECVMPPGSALFFHANLLHSSQANTSDRPRRAYICCYNAWSNVPFGGRGHGRPVPIELADDGAVLRAATATATAR